MDRSKSKGEQQVRGRRIFHLYPKYWHFVVAQIMFPFAFDFNNSRKGGKNHGVSIS